MNAWQRLLAGVGGRSPDPGNMANGPAAPPVQQGPYEWIQWQMLNLRFTTTNILPVPPAYQNMQHMMLSVFPLSGMTGGGTTGLVPQNQIVNSLYYDPQTGTYIDLFNGTVRH